MRMWLKRIVIVGVVVFALLQLVPYGWSKPNPAVTQDAPWPSEAARDLAVAACYDCHSNETKWPVYSYVAPMSWLVKRDVLQGRDELNFSEWDSGDNDAHDAAEAIEDGDMPPSRYTQLHSDAKLSDEEKATLIAALEAMDDDEGDSDNSGPGNAEDRSGRGGGDNSGPGSRNSGRGSG